MVPVLLGKFVNCLLATVLFICWPLGGALYAFYKMVKNHCFTFYAVLFSLFMGLYGYTFNPGSDTDMDLSRIYRIADMLAETNFQEALPLFIVNGDLSYLYYWLVGYCGLSVQTIGMFSSMLLYGSFLFVIQKVVTLYGATSRSKIFVMGVMMCFLTTHPILFSGIRTAMALGLFFFGFGYYLSGRKKLSTLLMLSAVCIHFFFAVIVFFFFLFRKLSPKAVKRICWILLIGTFLYYPLMKLLVAIFMNLGSIGMVIAGKIEGYGLNWNTEYGIVLMYSRKWVIQTILLVMAFLWVRSRRSVGKFIKNDAVLREINIFTLLILCFAVFSIYNIVITGRMIYLINILCILFLVVVRLRTRDCGMIRIINGLSYFICFLGISIFINECLVVTGYTDYFKNVGALLSENLFSILNIKVEY